MFAAKAAALRHPLQRPTVRCVVAAGFAFLCVLTLNLDRAAAIEIHCIEASKYKYLYQIFGNDRRKMAAFLGVDAASLPDGEACRAVLVTGSIQPRSEAHKRGETVDAQKLHNAIEQNRGGLAVAYLASGGGNVQEGIFLGQIVRMFWLKVRSPGRDRFVYRPDFFPTNAASPFSGEPEIPAELAEGWQSYVRAVQLFSEVSIVATNHNQKHPTCASACTFLHTAGIDRMGAVYVHRPRTAPQDPRSMSQRMAGLYRTERAILAHYRDTDAGQAFMRQLQETPTGTVTSALADRFPRYVWDFLHAACGRDFAPLSEQLAAARLRQTWPGPVENCIARLHEKERLSQFTKYCRNGCDGRQINLEIKSKMQQLYPPTPNVTGSPPRR
jgi:hypothetical protein